MINPGPALVIIKHNGLQSKCTANTQWRPKMGGNSMWSLTYLRSAGWSLFTFFPRPGRSSTEKQHWATNREHWVGKKGAGGLRTRPALPPSALTSPVCAWMVWTGSVVPRANHQNHGNNQDSWVLYPPQIQWIRIFRAGTQESLFFKTFQEMLKTSQIWENHWTLQVKLRPLQLQ